MGRPPRDVFTGSVWLKHSVLQRLTAPRLAHRLAWRLLYAVTSPAVLRVVAEPFSWFGAAAALRQGRSLASGTPSERLRIAFDYQIFSLQPVGGISRYYTALVRELARMGQQVRIVAPLHRGQFLETLDGDLVTGWQQSRLPIDVGVVNRAFNVMASRAQLGAFSPQVVHETYYSPVRSAPRRIPVVLTVFDMIHELYPGEFHDASGFTRDKKAAVQRADHIICISRQTKSDLMALFGCSPDKISVIYLAADPPMASRDSRPRLAVAESPFLLYVGTRGGYKNFAGMLSAIAASPSIKRDFRVVAFGGGPFTAGETRAIADAGLGGRVTHVAGDDSVLDTLYGEAAALVYPSRYEGFGLPPLEAMIRGCPVICSNASSLPEVVGDAAEVFAPDDLPAMIRAMESVLYSDDRRATLIRRGLERARQFSWSRCAEETVAVYRSLTA